MTLDEAIKHAEEVADTCEYEASKYDVCDSYEKHVAYQEGKCAEEHRQIAEWLKELKRVRELPWLKELKELRAQKRQHGEWIPVTFRPMDEEEYEEYKKEFGELPIEDRKMFSCPMPEDDQEILVCTPWRGVSQDRCEIDEYGYALEEHGDWDGVTAWMPLPEPYKKEGDEK